MTATRTASLAIARSVPHGRVRAQTCRIDRTAWKPCTRTFVVRDLADGAHTAQVRLVLRGGLTATASAAWRVDTVAPSAPPAFGGSAEWTALAARTVTHGAALDPAPAVPTLCGAPDGWTPAAAVQLSITGSGAVERQRSTDGGAKLGRVRIRHPGRRDRGGRDPRPRPRL